MKNKIIYLTSVLVALFVFSPQAMAQNDEFTSTIKTRGRFVEDKGIELRFFPDRRAILNTGLKTGFIIERADGNNNNFIEIARLQPFTDEQWENAIDAAEGNPETQDYLDLAWNFLKSATTPSGGSFNFSSGISDMRTQRANEDFEYAVFVLSAIREAKVAEALALSFIDSDISKGETYTYRVKTIGSHPLYSVIPEPYTLKAIANDKAYKNEVYVYEGDTELNFVWEETEDLTGYFVERKAPGENSFTPLNEAPLYNISDKVSDDMVRGSYQDDSLTNYQLYAYRFYANNLYGEKLLVAEVEAMPRDRTPPGQPFLEKPEHTAPREVEVKWQMNDVAPDLMGFAVGRSDKPEGNFTLLQNELLPASTRSFVDTSFVVGARNYYVVQAVDTAFNVSSSLPVAVTLIDTVPPIQPIIESALIDSLGVVTLNMTQNPEKDLMGYRLFRANDPEHEFSVISEGFLEVDSMDNPVQLIYTDTVTLNSLTPSIFYRVKALDFNYNQSDFSDIMKVERPDTIPPTTPVFKRLVNSTNQIELHFALSASKDVAAHQLYRKESMDAPWVVYANLETTQKTFIDREAEQGVTYYYSLRALDNSGLYSDYAHPVFGKAYDDGVRDTVTNLTLSEEDGNITLTWDYANLDDDTFFVVFKAGEKGRLRGYKRTNELSFSDRIGNEESVTYAIRTHTNDGGQSKLSETVSFEP
ncbi:hypothetical protein SAMN06265379_101278 [Saccharicrinis carchari]|uniref:Fibronectin type 3 domain-containing protein n=1 Tax=Saccharicrinis carchari TaxID=1168039 RepID=A0A521ANI4_SACCC|nr:hypothetical protein [Saccharicrinis carchari]SMO36358.1 hypothetical protein SAMN06265379_101278 [Saccharicrinis carchari]